MISIRAARAAAAYVPFLVVCVLDGLLASPTKNDFFQFWWAGRLIATGRSPYDPSAWSAALAYGPLAGSTAEACASPNAATCLWIYPPWTAWLFAPTGALDRETGIAIQRVALLAALAIGAALWLRFVRASPATTGALLVGFAASAIFLREVVLGHFEGLLLVGLYLLARGLRDARTWPLVAGVVVIALKPHLFVALAPLVVLWLVSKRAYRLLGSTALALGTLAVVGFASDPLALPALLGGAAGKPSVATATTWGFAARIGGQAAPAVAMFVVVFAIVAAAAAWRRSVSVDRAAVLVAAGAALSLAIAPYAQSYDVVLLFPALAVALAARGRRASVIGAAAVVVATWASYLLELSGDPRAFAATLPTIVLVVLALAIRERPAVTPPPASGGARTAVVRLPAS